MKDLLAEYQTVQAKRQRFSLFELAVANCCDEFGRPIRPPDKPGPRPCCAEFAPAMTCDGDTDTFTCSHCGRSWTEPCPHPTV